MWDYNLVKVFLRFLTQQVIGCKGHHKALEKLKSVRPQDFSDDLYQLQLGTRILEKELQNFLQENDAQNNTDMSRCSFPGGAVTGREVAAAPCIALALWCAKALGKVNRGNRGPLFPSKTPFSSPPASLRTGSSRRDESPSICTTCKILSILTSSSANHGISQVQMLTQRSWRNQMKCNHPKVHLWPCDQMTTLGHSSSYLLPALKQPQRDEVSWALTHRPCRRFLAAGQRQQATTHHFPLGTGQLAALLIPDPAGPFRGHSCCRTCRLEPLGKSRGLPSGWFLLSSAEVFQFLLSQLLLKTYLRTSTNNCWGSTLHRQIP